jgi:hypothetical protein
VQIPFWRLSLQPSAAVSGGLVQSKNPQAGLFASHSQRTKEPRAAFWSSRIKGGRTPNVVICESDLFVFLKRITLPVRSERHDTVPETCSRQPSRPAFETLMCRRAASHQVRAAQPIGSFHSLPRKRNLVCDSSYSSTRQVPASKVRWVGSIRRSSTRTPPGI